MESTGNLSDQLRQYLKTILRRTALLHLGSGMVSFIALGAWVFLALIVWTAIVDAPGLGMATFFGRGAMVLLAGLFVYFVVWPLIRMPRLEQLAAEVESRRDLKELVRAGFEFSNDPESAKRYSPALVKEVIRQAVERISGLQVRFLFLSRKDLALMPIAYGGLLILLLVALFNPSVLMRTSQRVVDPASAAAIDHRANIHATPGNVTVLAGSDVTVSGLDLGRSKDNVTVTYNLAEDFWKTEATTRVPGTAAASDGQGAFDRYDYTFADLRHTVSYYFEAGDYRSATYTITVVHEPILSDMTLELTPPSYTGEKPYKLENNGGNVQALEGTKVFVVGNSNNPVAGAWVRFNDGELEPIEFDGKQVAFEFTALEDGHYSVKLEDALGHETRDPLSHTIEVFQDNPPSLDVLEPGGDTALPRNRKLDIGFIANDDYGVRSAAIYFRKNSDSEFTRVGIPLAEQRGGKELAVAYRWELGDVQLFPGNYIEYFVQVADNNVVTGPGLAKSKMFQITVPTMAQLYDNVKEEEARRTDMMEQAIEESKEFRERLDKITREFIKTEKMEWSQKKDVDKALDQQKAVEEKLDQIKQSLDQTMQELSENQMTSQEIGEKMEEIRQLLDEISNDELRKRMEELREAVEKLSPEEIKEALENLEFDTEEMLKKLERTAQLLKQIQKEQKMEELVRQSRDLMDEQRQLNEQTEGTQESDSGEMNELSDRQEQLAEQADDLQESMEKFSKEMDDAQVQKQLQEMSKEMQKSDSSPQKDMKDASKSLQEQNKQQAMQQQQQAMEKMITLFQRVSQAQQQMSQNQGQQMAANFQKFARQTLEISFKQEALTNKLQENAVVEEGFDHQTYAQEQMSYLKATEKVADEIMNMAGSTLQVSPMLMEALGSAIDRMQNSVLFLEQNKSFMSTAHASNAVQSLNEATIEMLRSAKKCSQCTNGAGSGQTMAQQLMQQLIPAQQNVMKQTQQMLEMEAMAEALRQERQSQLDRLAGEQRSLQDIAKQIQESMQENREGLGRLDRVLEDMEQVVQSMQQGRLDADLVNKEQRILSRLLDADRSIHTRDFEKTRQSVTADEIFSKSLGGSAKEKVSESLREEIRRAMQLKAPGEFEDLIKLYFRALAEESTAGSRTAN